MIRVNKVFLGEGDANKMAKVADSINYPANELRITLERFVNGQRQPAGYNPNVDTVVFTESLVPASEGAFSTEQRVYVSLNALFSDGLYKLTVKNKRTGNVFTATATAIAPPSAMSKNLEPDPAPVYPFPANTSTLYYVDYSNPNTVYEERHTPPPNAMIYQLTIRMHYYDSVSYLVEPDRRHIDYVVGTRNNREIRTLSVYTYLAHTFTGAGIFATVANAMTKENHNIVGRKMYAAEYFVIASTREYLDYMEYVKPSLSIAQTKPLYSNFTDGKALGLFTFRSTYIVKKNLSNFYINAFADNSYTCNYKFFNARLEVPGCR